MALELTLSCDADKIESGPTLVHSTGVENYKIPPEIIRLLQEDLTNELLLDHEDGVICHDNVHRVLDLFYHHGFTLQSEINDNDKALWILSQTSSTGNEGDEQPGDSEQPDPQPADGTDADTEGAEQGGDDETGNKEAEEQEQPEEE